MGQREDMMRLSCERHSCSILLMVWELLCGKQGFLLPVVTFKGISLTFPDSTTETLLHISPLNFARPFRAHVHVVPVILPSRADCVGSPSKTECASFNVTGPFQAKCLLFLQFLRAKLELVFLSFFHFPHTFKTTSENLNSTHL